MSAGLRLEGSMIPRRVKRMFDERGEPRDATGDRAGAAALIEWRGTTLTVGVANISRSGAMVICREIPHIGEAIALQLPDRSPLPGVVRWVRDGRIGISFTAPLK